MLCAPRETHVIQRLQPLDVDATAECITASFLQCEPMARTLLESAIAVGGAKAEVLFRAEFRAFMQGVCEQAARDQLSFIAKGVQSGRVVAYSINERLAAGDGAPPPDAIKPVFDVLGILSNTFMANRKNSGGGRGAFHIFLIGTATDRSGYGLAKRVVEESVLLARSLAEANQDDMREAVTEATSGSQAVFAKLGFKKGECSVRYALIPAFAKMKAAEYKMKLETHSQRGWPDSCELMTLPLRR